MNGQKQKFSELKKQAREAMAGRCGTLVGATAINLFLTFSCSLIPTLIFSGTTLYDIIFLNLTLFISGVFMFNDAGHFTVFTRNTAIAARIVQLHG